jgi:hypothetical protein
MLKTPPAALMYVGHFDSGAAQLFKNGVIPLKLEGLVAKRADSIYRPWSGSSVGRGDSIRDDRAIPHSSRVSMRLK